MFYQVHATQLIPIPPVTKHWSSTQVSTFGINLIGLICRAERSNMKVN